MKWKDGRFYEGGFKFGYMDGYGVKKLLLKFHRNSNGLMEDNTKEIIKEMRNMEEVYFIRKMENGMKANGKMVLSMAMVGRHGLMV